MCPCAPGTQCAHGSPCVRLQFDVDLAEPNGKPGPLAGPQPRTGAGTGPLTNADANTDAGTDTHANTDTHADANTDPHAHAGPNRQLERLCPELPILTGASRTRWLRS